MSYSPNLLKGQKALVTGASSGIGEEVARALAASGAAVAVNYHSEQEAAEKIVSEIKSLGGEAIAIGANVAKEEEVLSMFDQMYQHFGTIDILVNNAGLQKDSAFVDMTLDHWNLVIGIHLMMQSIAQELAPHRIRVNSIAPGAIKTPINKAAWDTPEAEAKLLKLIPANRVGDVADIAKAAVWLASDDSDYVNGTTLFVDGGMTLYPGFAAGG